MASLVLGAIGGYFFGPLGFMVGSALGSMLDPQKTEGPRMQDKHLQGSTYGESIPIPYANIRSAGQVIWTTDLIEHKHQSGGKGGPQVTTYTYTASFDVLISESDDLYPNSKVIGLQKIWADGTLIYDTTDSGVVDNALVPVTVYFGEETQLPDPTEEAVLGVGNVPAYRGLFRCVFTDWDLGTWGNRLPSLTFQYFTRGGDIPYRVSSFDPRPITAASQYTPSCTYDDGVITVVEPVGVNGFDLYTSQFNIDGTQIGSTVMVSIASLRILQTVANSRAILCVNYHTGIDYYWLIPDPDNVGGYIQGAAYPEGAEWQGNVNVYQNDAMYTCLAANIGGETCIGKYTAVAGIPISAPLVATGGLGAIYPHSTVAIGTSNTGHIYVCVYVSGPNSTELWKFDEDLNLIKYWSPSETVGTNLRGSELNFAVYNDLIVNEYTTGGLWYVSLVRIGAGDVLEDYGVPLLHTRSSRINLSGCLLLDMDGVFSVCPPASPIPLSDIVSDISDRVGLDSASEYDTSALIPLVPGYLITRQSSGRDNVMQLRTAYFFDGVESSGLERFVMRGGPSVITIADNDLAAQEGGAGLPPPIVTVKRAQEQDLPATTWVTYFNPEADYQNNTQYSRRLVTSSQANARVDLSIALYDDTARSISAVLLWSTWYERTSLLTLTSRKFSWYEPTDVITAGGYMMRLTGKSNIANNIVQFEGVATHAGLFISGAVGVPGSGFNPPIITVKLPTDLLLLDIPLVNDNDLPNGIYAGMAGATGATGGTWPGASLQKSSDGGSSYASIGTQTIPTTMGATTTALGEFAGGNMFDEGNSVTVVIGPGGGELTSADELSVLNGANIAVLGFEIIQFKTADLIATDTYTLSGLLRGRRGTEWAIIGHSIGERFCLLPTLDAPLLFGELAQSRLYKPVTIGTSLASATAQSFISYGQALRPYAPVQFAGGPVDPFDGTVEMNWHRRTRTGGAWSDFTDVPVSEPSEAYVVQIWDAAYAVCARVITGLTSPTCTYSAADQVTDFGVIQQEIYATVGQIGVYTLGNQTRAIIPGLGGSIDAPLNPVPPYNSSPIPPSGGGGTVNVVLTWPSDQETTFGYQIGDTWVSEFTTSASGPLSGHVDASEFQDPAYYRHSWLATDAAGLMMVPGTEQWGNQTGVIISPALSLATTYYFIVKSELPNGDPSGPPGAPAQMHITLVGAPP